MPKAKRSYTVAVTIKDEGSLHGAETTSKWESPTQTFIENDLPEWIVATLLSLPFQVLAPPRKRRKKKRAATKKIGFQGKSAK